MSKWCTYNKILSLIYLSWLMKLDGENIALVSICLSVCPSVCLNDGFWQLYQKVLVQFTPKLTKQSSETLMFITGFRAVGGNVPSLIPCFTFTLVWGSVDHFYTSEVEGVGWGMGVYWFPFFRLSVSLSLCRPKGVHFVSSAILAGSVS